MGFRVFRFGFERFLVLGFLLFRGCWGFRGLGFTRSSGFVLKALGVLGFRIETSFVVSVSGFRVGKV